MKATVVGGKVKNIIAYSRNHVSLLYLRVLSVKIMVNSIIWR